jgi:HSP20 family protein
LQEILASQWLRIGAAKLARRLHFSLQPTSDDRFRQGQSSNTKGDEIMLPTFNELRSALLSDPFEAFLPGREAMRRSTSRSVGAIGMWEEEGRYLLEMDLPGVKIEDLDITVEKDQLSIRAERRLAEGSQAASYDERSYGSFQRVVRLGEEIDSSSIDATLKDGVLRLTIAKKPEHRPQRIAVRGEGQSRLAND